MRGPRGSGTAVSVHRDLARVVRPQRRPGGRALPCLCSPVRRSLVRRPRPALRARPKRKPTPLHAAPAGPSSPRAAAAAATARSLPASTSRSRRPTACSRARSAAMEDARCFESFFIFGRGLVRSPKCLEHERPCRGRAPPAHPASAAAPGSRAAAATGVGRPSCKMRSPAVAAASAAQRSAPRRLVRLLRRRRRTRSTIPDAGLSQHRPERPLPDGLRAALRRLLLSDPLLDLWQPCRRRTPSAASRIVRRPPSSTSTAIRDRRSSRPSRSGLRLYGPPCRAQFRKEYVKGCSCKQAEYNPTEIEAANKRRAAEPARMPPARRPRRRRRQAAAPDAAGHPASRQAAPPTVQAAPPAIEPAAPPAPPPDAAAVAAARRLPRLRTPCRKSRSRPPASRRLRRPPPQLRPAAAAEPASTVAKRKTPTPASPKASPSRNTN